MSEPWSEFEKALANHEETVRLHQERQLDDSYVREARILEASRNMLRAAARKAVEGYGHVPGCECGTNSPEESQRAFRDPRCLPNVKP